MAAPNRCALIVESQPFGALVASDILAEEGLESLHAEDGERAMAMLQSHPQIAVMVADADLLGPVNGVEWSRSAMKQRPDIRLVVTSSGPGVNGLNLPEGARVLRLPYASSELRALVSGRPVLQQV